MPDAGPNLHEDDLVNQADDLFKFNVHSINFVDVYLLVKQINLVILLINLLVIPIL